MATDLRASACLVIAGLIAEARRSTAAITSTALERTRKTFAPGCRALR